MTNYTAKSLFSHSHKFIRIERLIIQVLMVAIVSVFFLLASASQQAYAVNLKSSATINGNMITLGDLFDGLQNDADRVLGPAPQPGQNMVLNARTLLRVANAFNLPWRPQTSFDQITLRRDATIIGAEVISKTLKEELKNKGIRNEFKVNFYQAYPKIVLPGNMASSVEIKSIDVDHNNNRFSALVVAPNLENPVQTLELSGEIVKTMMIPVAKDVIQAGDLISKNLIDWIEVEQITLFGDTITSLDELVNMTPRRVLFSGKPVSSKEIIAPRLVERGGEVTMVYENGGMSLTAKGKALQGGSKGETIRVMNLASSRPVEAIVTADHTVTVYN